MINNLIAKIKAASDAYYNSDTPIMTDDEFDLLTEQLRALDPTHPALKVVGAPPSETTVWPKVKHTSIVGSQNKVNSKEEFVDWSQGKGHVRGFINTWKMDGSSILSTYVDGKLIYAITRGSNGVGENITPNFIQMKNAAQTLGDFTGVLRGEVVLPIPDFNRVFLPQDSKNSRNTGNGLMRAQTYKPEEMALLTVKWFDVSGPSFKTEIEKLEFIEDVLKLETVPYVVCNTADDVWDVFEKTGKARDAGELDYAIDGMVVKVNDIDEQESYGVSDNRPKGQVAIKWKNKGAPTVLRSITWQVGLTGRITPVGELEPVDVDGITISRVMLNNMDFINNLKIKIGDEVQIVRANDVIPMASYLVKDNGGPKVVPPTTCPTCSGPLTKDGAYIICPNLACSGKVYGDMMTWVQELQIKGFGPSLLRALIENGIDNVIKLYSATVADFALASNSESLGQKLYDNLHARKKMALSTFLPALNIHTLGNTNARRLESKFRTLSAVLAATPEQIREIEGIQTFAEKMVDGLKSKAADIAILEGILTIENLPEGGVLLNESYCCTGKLSLDREEIHKTIINNGGTVKTSVSKGLTYLITNTPNSGSSKNKKADEYGTKKITEQEFFDLVRFRKNKI